MSLNSGPQSQAKRAYKTHDRVGSKDEVATKDSFAIIPMNMGKIQGHVKYMEILESIMQPSKDVTLNMSNISLRRTRKVQSNRVFQKLPTVRPRSSFNANRGARTPTPGLRMLPPHQSDRSQLMKTGISKSSFGPVGQPRDIKLNKKYKGEYATNERSG